MTLTRTLLGIFLAVLVGSVTGLVLTIGIIGNQQRVIDSYARQISDLQFRDLGESNLSSALSDLYRSGRFEDETVTTAVVAAFGPISNYTTILLEVEYFKDSFRIVCIGDRPRCEVVRR